MFPVLFTVLFILTNASEQLEYSFTTEYSKSQIKIKELTDCSIGRPGYTQIEKESANTYDNGNYYACNIKFRGIVKINQGLLLLHNCNFTNIAGNPGLIYIVTPENPQSQESVEIQNCHFYRTRQEAIHIESKSQLNEINIVKCSFEKCESTIDKKISAIYLKAAVGKIEDCRFINNKADGADIYYSNSLTDGNGRVTFKNNFFKRAAGSLNGRGNLIQFDEGSLFDFIDNRISVSKYSGLVKLFTWPANVNDLTGYKFEGNSMFPVNNDIINNKFDLLKDFFPEQEELDCPPPILPIEGTEVKQFCGSVLENSNSQGIKATQSFISIVYSTFHQLSNNNNNNKGGAVYISISKNMPIYDDPIMIYNSDFTSCYAMFGLTIYIECYQDSMKFDFKDCYFGNNIYSGGDYYEVRGDVKGTIYIDTKFSGFEFTRCSFNNNEAGEGGAIYYISDTTDTVEIETNPNDYSLHLKDCRFNSNMVMGHGGSLFISFIGHEHSRPVLIETSIFYFCTGSEVDSGKDQPENGGAIYYSTSYTSHVDQPDSFEFRVIDCEFQQGFTTFRGGGIYLLVQNEEPSRSFEIGKSCFRGNTIDRVCYDDVCPSGVDIFFEYDTTTPSSSQVTQNDRILYINDCLLTKYVASSKGGSISILIKNTEPSKSIEINGCTISSSSKHQNYEYIGKSGGAIYYDFVSPIKASKTLLDETSTGQVYSLLIVDCIFISNVVEETGGSIEINIENNEPSNPIEISRCTFEQGQSGKNGGHINVIFNPVSLASTTFSKEHTLYINDCTFTGVEGTSLSANGGSIYIDIQNGQPSKSIEINNCTFTTCFAAGIAGAIYYNYFSSSTNGAKSLLEDARTAKVYALNIVGCSFTSNKAGMAGGALAINIEKQDPSNPIEIRGCTFTKNVANDDEIDTEYGGAIYYLNKATSTFSKSLLESSDYGFGIFDSKFNENDASYYGGAISIRLINEKPSNHIRISDCSFDKNSASIADNGCGASICYEFIPPVQPSSNTLLEDASVSLSVNNCVFSEGKATSMGDLFIEIRFNIATTIEFNNCSFKDSGPEGFFLYSTNPSSLFHFNDCDFLTSSTIFFNSDVASAKIENCRFNDMKSSPISYTSVSETPTLSNSYEFRVERCNFTQTSEIDSLVYFKSNLAAQFYFISNNISIENENTRALGSENAIDISSIENGWHFENNIILPGIGKFIKTESAKNIPASCTKGFICADLPQCGDDIRCDFNSTNIEGEEKASVNLTSLKFNNLKHDDNGAAIHIYNYQIQCSQLEFNNCSSDKSGGGIYIYLDKVIDDTIKLENLKFTSCQAVCGGGIFIYSEPTANKIDIYKCKFFSNSASIESENNDDFYGGSAIYLASVSGTIIKCSFKNNVGNGVKIVNKFEDLEKSKMSIKTQLSLSITDCEFEVDEESKSSILYVSGKNDEIPVEVNGCVFKGNLAEGNYHIDGELHETKNEMMNFHIKSCKFPNGIKSAVNTKNSMILLDSVEIDKEEIGLKSYEKVEEKSRSKTDMKIISFIIAALACAAVISAIIVHFTMKRNQQTDDESSIEL